MTETTAPTDYTELRKAAEKARDAKAFADLIKSQYGTIIRYWEADVIANNAKDEFDRCCGLGTILEIFKQHDALLDAHATVVAERDALREALKPMAIAAKNFDSYPVKDATQWFAFGGSDSVEGRVGAISVADLRAARSAYEATEPTE